MAFKDEEIEAELKAAKEEYEAKVAKINESRQLLADKKKAADDIAKAKEALKEAEKALKDAQKAYSDIDLKIDKALGKKKASKAPKAPAEEGAPRAKRGTKAAKVLEALSEVYPEGYTVKELETKLGEKNLGVWFSTTGSNIAGVTRPKRGYYVYKAPAEETPAPVVEALKASEKETTLL